MSELWGILDALTKIAALSLFFVYLCVASALTMLALLWPVVAAIALALGWRP